MRGGRSCEVCGLAFLKETKARELSQVGVERRFACDSHFDMPVLPERSEYVPGPNFETATIEPLAVPFYPTALDYFAAQAIGPLLRIGAQHVEVRKGHGGHEYTFPNQPYYFDADLPPNPEVPEEEDWEAHFGGARSLAVDAYTIADAMLAEKAKRDGETKGAEETLGEQLRAAGARACAEVDVSGDGAQNAAAKEDAETAVIVTRAELDVLTERWKQVRKYGDEHDDKHTHQELSDIAGNVAMGFHDEWNIVKRNSKDRRKQLVIAGALIIAELERLDRASARFASSVTSTLSADVRSASEPKGTEADRG